MASLAAGLKAKPHAAVPWVAQRVAVAAVKAALHATAMPGAITAVATAQAQVATARAERQYK